MRYFLLPLGCATNKADSERIAAVLESIGYTLADNEEDASVIGIVACSIRQSAIDRVYSKIHKWNQRKRKKPLITFVSGCILQEDQRKFLKLFDLLVKLEEVSKLPQMLKEYGVVAPQSFWEITPRRGSSYKALVPIQNGCDKFCTFCAVPYTRGREESRPSAEILTEVDELLVGGYKQITLLGQNVNSYGLDVETEMSFAELLREIGKKADAAPHKVWVHYTSPHPRDMNADVYEVQSSSPSLANYLNLPLQSGDDEVLRRMNRRYSLEQYLEKLDLARKYMPDLTVSTDIIVGFCGETTEQFERTRAAMVRGKFDLAFIAQYSARPGAVAQQRFQDDVAKADKKQRDIDLTDVLRETAAENNQKLVGKVITVLVEQVSRKPGKLLGRSEGLKSVEFESGDQDLIGNFVDMKITSADAWRLQGELIGFNEAN